MTSRLEKIYKEEVVPALMKQFGYTNPMEVPKLVKVTLNMGVGEAATNKKIPGKRRRGHDQDFRPEAGCHQVAYLGRVVQDP